MSEDLPAEPDGSITDLRGQPVRYVVATPPPTGDVVAVLDDILGRFQFVRPTAGDADSYDLSLPCLVGIEDFERWCALRDQIKEAQRLWLPPPPGDTREQLPEHILAMLAPLTYLSTACEVAQMCELAIGRYPEAEAELIHWATWLHKRRCRENNKYSGKLCVCPCHREEGS